MPRDHVSHRRSLEPRHHHPRLRQRRLLRLPHHHPDPLPLLPEVMVMIMMMMMMMVWEQEARQGRGRHLQQLHHLQHRAGLSQHQPQSGEAHPGDAASRVTCHISTVTCHVSGHPPSRGPDRAAGAEPRRAQVCARRDAGAVRHGPARPHQHTVTKYFSCVYINILFLFQDTWIWCAEASVSCLHCVTRRYR